ncbi:MAG: undecaprenyl-diphosphate phosphatase [Elusimicrobiales bacterium]
MIKAVVLGLVQGFGEFLPISSSAHLALVPDIFHWQYQGLAYDVMLHLGTLIALLIYFRKDWAVIISRGLQAPRSPEGGTLWLLAAGTVPAAIAGLLLEKKAEMAFRAPWLIAVMLMIFAVILYLADRRASEGGKSALSLKTALVIGSAQALALAPGVSRSGITITAALLLGFSRAEAARISFLFSVPVLAGAAVLQLRHITPAMLDGAFAAAFAASLAGGWLAVSFLMGFLRRHSLRPFVYYRLGLGALILLLSWRGWFSAG